MIADYYSILKANDALIRIKIYIILLIINWIYELIINIINKTIGQNKIDFYKI